MISREELVAKIARVPDERLEEVSRMLEHFTKPEAKDEKKSFMQRLQEISIDLPPDAASNIDDYLYGDKKF